MPSSFPHARCPFCGLEMHESTEALSDDHIFGQAMGGRTTVRAHKSCNNQSGSDAEGTLQRPGMLHNLVKAAQGLKAQPIPGTFDNGKQVRLDLQQGTGHVPPRLTTDPNGTSVRIEASDLRTAEKMYKGFQAKHPRFPAFTALPDDALAVVSATDVRLSIEYHDGPAQEVGIKAALGAGVRAYGPDFAVSPLAHALRDHRDHHLRDAGRHVGFFPDGWDRAIHRILVAAGWTAADADRLPKIAHAPRQTLSDVVFAPDPQDRQRTLLYVRIASIPTPMNAIRLDAPLPALNEGVQPLLPILLRDWEPGRLQQVDYTWESLQPAMKNL